MYSFSTVPMKTLSKILEKSTRQFVNRYFFFFSLLDNELIGLYLFFSPNRKGFPLSFSGCILHAACLQFSYLSDIQFQRIFSICHRPLIRNYRIMRRSAPFWNPDTEHMQVHHGPCDLQDGRCMHVFDL